MVNCFRASCTVKGAYKGERSIDAAKAYLSGNAIEKQKTKHVPLPKYTTSPHNHAPAIDYLKQVNSYEAFASGRIKIRYAPAEDRVLFYSHNNAGAVGRSLGGSKYKWWNFGDLSEGIHVGEGTSAVLVEDAPSACSVSNLKDHVGVALLGTSLTNSIRRTLNKYTKLTLVLDKDANRKAISYMSPGLQVRLTERDLKWLTTEQIQNLLR